MSTKVSYNGNEILNLSTDGTATLNTKGKFCEEDIVVSSQGNNWYDFSVELTSDFAHGGELLDALVPYIQNLTEKQVAIFTLENQDGISASNPGIAIQCFICYSGSGFYGQMSRYRSVQLVNAVVMSNGYSLSPMSGLTMRCKVVNVLA